MSVNRPTSYQVLMTPLIQNGTYGTIVDVTKDVEIDDLVKEKGIGKIKREVDNGDFSFGVFTFDSITLKCINFDGKFSDPGDARSMFAHSRDKAKVTVNFFDGVSQTPDISFKGIIDDRATKLKFSNDEIKFTVLSPDSIINREKVPSGLINDGDTTTAAIKKILQLPLITTVLNYIDGNINPLDEIEIDDGEYFNNMTVKDALDELFIVSNSTMIVEKSTDNIIVRGRKFNTGTVKTFFGPGDVFGRENIIDIKKYNNGLQRAFSTIEIGDRAKTDLGAVDVYGDNKKAFDFGFLTDNAKKDILAQNLVNYWKAPKTEMEIETKTSEVRDLSFFDLISINYPYRVKPSPGEKLPVYGVAKYGQAVYPFIFGNQKIRPKPAFKVIGFEEDPKTFTTKVKVRQIGTSFSDGYFSSAGTFYGTSIYGQDEYQSDPSRLDPNRISVYGAGKYGTVLYREA